MAAINVYSPVHNKRRYFELRAARQSFFTAARTRVKKVLHYIALFDKK
jgi:hypothetical protein